MEDKEINLADIQFILESLQYTKQSYVNNRYDNHEFKQEQIRRVEKVMDKIRNLRDTFNEF